MATCPRCQRRQGLCQADYLAVFVQFDGIAFATVVTAGDHAVVSTLEFFT